MLLSLGKSQGIKVKRSEINTALYSVMDQFEVTSKKELKEQIVKAGGSYEAMLNQLKDDIISSKTRTALLGSVKIEPNDLNYLDQEFEIKLSLVALLFCSNNRPCAIISILRFTSKTSLLTLTRSKAVLANCDVF